MTIHQDRLEELCRRHDIALLRIFDSAFWDEEGTDGDVDFLVEFTTRTSLLDLFCSGRKLAELVGRQVDLVTTGALGPYLRDRVLQTTRVLHERAG